MRNTVVIILLILSLPAAVLAVPAASLRAETGIAGDAVLTLRVRGDAASADWKGVVVMRTRLGSCAPPVRLQEEPLPLPAPGDVWEETFVATLPEPGAVYRFDLVILDGDDHAVAPDPLDHEPTRAHVAAGQAVAQQGRVEHVDGLEFRIVGCDARCWPISPSVTPDELNVTDLQMLVWATHNTVLTIYGLPDDTESGPWFDHVSEIKTSFDCSAVANERSSWSSLKSLYR